MTEQYLFRVEQIGSIALEHNNKSINKLCSLNNQAKAKNGDTDKNTKNILRVSSALFDSKRENYATSMSGIKKRNKMHNMVALIIGFQ